MHWAYRLTIHRTPRNRERSTKTAASTGARRAKYRDASQVRLLCESSTASAGQTGGTLHCTVAQCPPLPHYHLSTVMASAHLSCSAHSFYSTSSVTRSSAARRARVPLPLPMQPFSIFHSARQPVEADEPGYGYGKTPRCSPLQQKWQTSHPLFQAIKTFAHVNQFYSNNKATNFKLESSPPRPICSSATHAHQHPQQVHPAGAD